MERLGSVLEETATPCYAWALIPNHFHLLIRTGLVPVATVMRRFLTGYAVSFNHRHRRSGHLFQNRYKSILCQEDPYLLELVRYIHLNPIRAGLLADLQSLDQYPYSGHSRVVGKMKGGFQDTETVLSMFGKARREARRRNPVQGRADHRGRLRRESSQQADEARGWCESAVQRC